ncbi:MAG: signal peptidase I [Chloroflexia bacterium]|nr:signal peptidase I [Chloroflexia bacterium]
MTPDGDFSPALGRDGRPDSVPAEVVAAPTPSARNQAGRAVREIVETLLLAALIFFLVRLVVLNFRVDGESMLPNLDDGQMLLVNRNAYQYFVIGGNRYYPFDPPERGDVVVFDPPTGSDKPYIKRIIGLPDEVVTFGDGHVYVDGEVLAEDYIDDRTRCGRADTCDVVVPDGYIYVLGDHRSNSSDSRVFGAVPVENVVGKAWLSYWPMNDVGFVPHESYEGDDAAAAQPAAST